MVLLEHTGIVWRVFGARDEALQSLQHQAKDSGCFGPCTATRAECSLVLRPSGVPGVTAAKLGLHWVLPLLGESGRPLNQVCDLELGLNLSTPQVFY